MEQFSKVFSFRIMLNFLVFRSFRVNVSWHSDLERGPGNRFVVRRVQRHRTTNPCSFFHFLNGLTVSCILYTVRRCMTLDWTIVQRLVCVFAILSTLQSHFQLKFRDISHRSAIFPLFILLTLTDVWLYRTAGGIILTVAESHWYVILTVKESH